MSLSMTGFDVSLSAYIGNPQVSSFNIHIKGGLINRTCTLNRHSSPLTCSFTGLMSGSQYTVRAAACLPDQLGCSETTKLTTWTIPSRKPFNYFTPFGYTLVHLFSKVHISFFNSTINWCIRNIPYICHGWSWTTWRRPSYTTLHSHRKEWVARPGLYNKGLHPSLEMPNK